MRVCGLTPTSVLTSALRNAHAQLEMFCRDTRRTTMDFRRRIRWTGVALGVVLAIGGPLAATTAGAQGPGGAVVEPYTPAPGAKDLRAVLFHWMWSTGMLKGHDERDMVA